MDRGCGATEFGDDEINYWRAMDLLATARADGNACIGDFLIRKLREEREGLGEIVILISRSLGGDLVGSVGKLRAAGLFVIVVALAAHTYYRGESALPGRENAFYENVQRLKLAGATVHVVRRPGGVAAFARGQRWAAGG